MSLLLLNNQKAQYIIALFLIIGQGIFCFAQTKTYSIATEKSEIAFKVNHLGVLNIEGIFHDFSGNLVFKDTKLQEVNCSISIKSIDTNDRTRDESLMGVDYLDVINYPIISFTSTKISKHKNTITGILKIKNVEKLIVMPFEFLQDEGSLQIKILTTIDRKDFNLDFGAMDLFVGEKIKIVLRIKTN